MPAGHMAVSFPNRWPEMFKGFIWVAKQVQNG
jgi:hypothetical protein